MNDWKGDVLGVTVILVVSLAVSALFWGAFALLFGAPHCPPGEHVILVGKVAMCR